MPVSIVFRLLATEVEDKKSAQESPSTLGGSRLASSKSYPRLAPLSSFERNQSIPLRRAISPHPRGRRQTCRIMLNNVNSFQTVRHCDKPPRPSSPLKLLKAHSFQLPGRHKTPTKTKWLTRWTTTTAENKSTALKKSRSFDMQFCGRRMKSATTVSLKCGERSKRIQRALRRMECEEHPLARKGNELLSNRCGAEVSPTHQDKTRKHLRGPDENIGSSLCRGVHATFERQRANIPSKSHWLPPNESENKTGITFISTKNYGSDRGSAYQHPAKLRVSPSLDALTLALIRKVEVESGVKIGR
jgi:hypothetical protein